MKKNIFIFALIFLLGFISAVSMPDPFGDYDSDGVLNQNDNCYYVWNPFQADNDGDERGNCCDASYIMNWDMDVYCDDPYQESCGNSVIETGEQCDDGNLISEDGCSAICQNETIIPPTNETNSTEAKRVLTSMKNHYVQFCDVNWECSGWSECSDGVMKRSCYDSNYCKVSYNKPIEEIGCEDVLVEEKEANSSFNYSWILLLIPTIIFVLVLIWLLRGKR